ncbi:GSCFA domain-containing protein [Puniceibacterium sp. IMCC21224]|uniref:GSCFA domain-containing protein n=1 Tax=Puniceibacterium sp. IMCC21224 TaxID=1618204 RepID=UPI00065D668B|nr:GSCFA domain-containing protein [Puniceibacterium sp. IMCC21224]KMK65152.1 GSCFA family protein [Puniceibacterium sp. IMCC21224]
MNFPAIVHDLDIPDAMSENFYSGLEARSFWKLGVAETNPLVPADIYRKKWTIAPEWEIGTAGSCFAQHIARHMTKNGYDVVDVEPAPKGLAPDLRQSYGFSLYSGRYGNIYTTRQLLQLIEEVFSHAPPEPLIWQKDGRFYDALRPNIEPGGFASVDELVAARAYHLARLRLLFRRIDLFVFTLGLTEAWMHRASGRVTPLAPGVIAGQDVAEDYAFVNFGFPEVLGDFQAAMAVLAQNRDKSLRTIVTVSPVPLTATATGQHVLPATNYSKAVLRAVAGHLSETQDSIDYFPSYEIVTNPAARGLFFAPNLRSVTEQGVATVMQTFFAAHPAVPMQPTADFALPQPSSIEDLQCEEALLEAFGK